MSTSRQSHRAYDASPLSPSISTSLPAADQEILLPASTKAAQASLKSLNDYIQKHYDQSIAQESLKHSRLAAAFAKKEREYKRQIATLKSTQTDIAGLLVRERGINVELRQKLEIANNSVVHLCNLITDANFVFVDRKSVPHGIKREESSQESADLSDIVICPDPAISSLLSQIETVVTEMNAQNCAGLPPPVDPSPCRSIIEALGKVVGPLLAAQRTLALLQGDFKSADAARADVECQDESLQEKFALLQEELERMRSDNERITQELVAGMPVVHTSLA